VQRKIGQGVVGEEFAEKTSDSCFKSSFDKLSIELSTLCQPTVWQRRVFIFIYVRYTEGHRVHCFERIW